MRVRSGKHPVLDLRGAYGEQDLADTGAVHRQPASDAADDGHRCPAHHPLQIEHLVALANREVHRGQRRRVDVMQKRLGNLAQSAFDGCQQARVPEQPARPRSARLSRRCNACPATSSAASRCAVANRQSARSASSDSDRLRCRSSNAPTIASKRDATLAPGVEVFPANSLIPSAQRKSSVHGTSKEPITCTS